MLSHRAWEMHQTFVKLVPTMLLTLTFFCFAAGTPARAAGDPTLGDKCHPPGQARCGDPINLYTGEVFSEIIDYETAGPNKLAFKRYYNPASGNDGVFGFAEWTSNFDANLFIYSSTEVDLFMADGKYVPIYLQNGIWTSFTDMDLRLTLSGSTWMLTDWDDNVTTFTGTVVGSNLRPTSLRTRNGYTQTLQYDTSGRLVSVTDSYGRTLTLSYNGSDVKVSNVTTPDGLVLSYSYPSSGSTFLKLTYSTNPPTTQSYQYDTGQTYFPRLLSGVVDEDGNQLSSWTYDSTRHATSSQHAGGADLWTISYNSDGTRTLTNALGQQEVYKFASHVGSPIAKLSEIDRLPTSTTAAATRKFTYESNGYIASQTDWNGDQTTFVNNAQGLPTTITEAADTQPQRVTTITYHPSFRLPTQIVTPGLTTSFAYDGNGNLLSRTETDTTTTNWPYSTNGQVRTWTYAWGSNFLPVSATDPRGDTTQFGYDASGTLTSITNALDQVTQITEHTGGGLPLTVVDPNGVVTNLAYDARQRLTSRTVSTAAGPLTTTYSYDHAGNLTQVTLPDGSALANTYDAAHRLVATADRFGQQIQYALDALSDRTQTNLLNSAGTVDRHHSATFDALGRMLEGIGGVGQITGFAYDSNGNRTTIADPLGRVRSQAFDALDHLTHITDPAGGTTSIAYDAHDHPISVTDPNGNATQYVYDGFGDVMASISPDAGTTVFYYDATGNLVQRVDARGAVTNFAYDALNRLLSRTYPGGSGENTSFTYDEPGAGFGVGRLTTVIDNGGHAGGLKLSYDERGNLVSAVRSAGAVTLAIAYAYDAASRVAIITYPSGWSAAYTRDQMGRVTAIAAQPPGPALPPAGRLGRPALGLGPPPANPAVVSAVTYLPFGPVSGLTYGNGIIETRGFDLDYRPTSLTDAGAATMQSLTYSYNAANNVTAIGDGVTPGDSQSFAYDALDRLVAASGGYGSLAYAYDPVGNLLSRTANDGYQSATVNFSYAAGSNRLTALMQGGVAIRQFSYTASGSIASDLKGEATLLTNAGARVLGPGMTAGFPAGKSDGHCLVNRGSRDVVYLEVGDRRPGDEVVYPDDDLAALWRDGRRVFTHSDGTPY
jgi:YD repeat-containing protein